MFLEQGLERQLAIFICQQAVILHVILVLSFATLKFLLVFFFYGV